MIDNSDGALDSEFSEISIIRRLDRDGEGEYRLNGARCRLVDVLEVLSDTGLGKEMHSVVSQGRVEAIVHSKPRDRRLLIEEAAGLGKHRKRRRRAQLKLERTQENLDRALDVEREARSRLRPLKRQAEAAELHERLERQSLEARYELVARRVPRGARAALAEAEEAAAAARAERDEAERLLAEVAKRREAGRGGVRRRSRATREQLQARLFAARSAAERIALRLERARELAPRPPSGASGACASWRARAQAAAEAEPGDEERAEAIAELEARARGAGRRARGAPRARAGGARGRAREARGAGASASAAAERRGALRRRGACRRRGARRAPRGRAGRRGRPRRAARGGAELAAVEPFLARGRAAPGGSASRWPRASVEPGLRAGPRRRARPAPAAPPWSTTQPGRGAARRRRRDGAAR